MYYVFRSTDSLYVQVDEVSRTSTQWNKTLLPWDPRSDRHWNRGGIFTQPNYETIATSPTPFTPESHPELFI